MKEAENWARCRRFVAVTRKEWVPQRDRDGSLGDRRYVEAATDWSHWVYSDHIMNEKPRGSDELARMANGWKGESPRR